MEHTQGKIRYDYEPGYCGELIAENGTSLCSFTDEPVAGNARRLVACWNACEGVSTETLELVPRFTEAGVKTVQSVEAEVAALKAQRDELLAGLERIANPIPYEQANVPEGYTLDGHALLAQVSKPLYYQTVARALIAKHKEASHG